MIEEGPQFATRVALAQRVVDPPIGRIERIHIGLKTELLATGPSLRAQLPGIERTDDQSPTALDRFTGANCPGDDVDRPGGGAATV